MKTFLFSLCALALLVGAILCNAAYVRNFTGRMQQDLQSLPACAQAKEEADALLCCWQEKEKILELSISATDRKEVGDRLIELCVAARLDDEEAFERARALCLDSITRIQDLERFSFLHIL